MICCTAAVPVDAQENVRESGPEPFCSLDWELSSPRSGGLETEDETAYVDLSTPQLNVSKDKLRLNQEALFSESTSVILELGVSPLASDSNEGNLSCFLDTFIPTSLVGNLADLVELVIRPATSPFRFCFA